MEYREWLLHFMHDTKRINERRVPAQRPLGRYRMQTGHPLSAEPRKCLGHRWHRENDHRPGLVGIVANGARPLAPEDHELALRKGQPEVIGRLGEEWQAEGLAIESAGLGQIRHEEHQIGQLHDWLRSRFGSPAQRQWEWLGWRCRPSAL